MSTVWDEEEWDPGDFDDIEAITITPVVIPRYPGETDGEWLVRNQVADPSGELAKIYDQCYASPGDACDIGRVALIGWSEYDRLERGES